jgi:hypothetical protein
VARDQLLSNMADANQMPRTQTRPRRAIRALPPNVRVRQTRSPSPPLARLAAEPPTVARA